MYKRSQKGSFYPFFSSFSVPQKLFQESNPSNTKHSRVVTVVMITIIRVLSHYAVSVSRVIDYIAVENVTASTGFGEEKTIAIFAVQYHRLTRPGNSEVGVLHQLEAASQHSFHFRTSLFIILHIRPIHL
jgi:hypothetical protein